MTTDQFCEDFEKGHLMCGTQSLMILTSQFDITFKHEAQEHLVDQYFLLLAFEFTARDYFEYLGEMG